MRNHNVSEVTTSRRSLSGIVILLGLVLAGCASDAELDTLKPQSDVARSIDDLMDPVLAVAGVVMVLICGVILYMAKRGHVDGYEELDFPEQIHGNNTLEVAWTIIPAVIMALIGAATVVTHLAVNDSEANAYSVEVAGETESWEPVVVVVGQQWWWEYRYYFDQDIDAEALGDPRLLPEADIVTSGQMAIPVGEEIELIISSRDVIHSHWIPALNGKRDARPGFWAPWKLEADDPGVYFGQCTEFCGLSHSRMRMQVTAMTDDDFQTWVDEQMTPAAVPAGAEDYVADLRAGNNPSLGESDSAAARGLEAFVSNCSSCHLIDGVNDLTYTGATTESGSAPDLTHFASRTTFAGGILNTYNRDASLNRDDLSAWIRDPQAMKGNAANGLGDGVAPRGMPTLGLGERTISDLVAYLETLGPKPSDELIAQTEVD
jgi:cytochrome c oxidase subunit 2